MNEIQLSDSLPVIETEIRQYQNLAGESIFEIGRRLKHVKENDLAHGEFGKWLKSIDMNDSQARKFMKVSEEFSNRSLGNALGMSVLYEIATLPEKEKRQTVEKIEGGETFTRSEIENYKKQLKQRDEENTLLQSKLDEAENKAPEVIEKYTEPEDYEDIKNMNEHLLGENERYKKMADDFRQEVKNNRPKEVEPVNQTDLILRMIDSVEEIIFSDAVEIDEAKTKSKLTNIIERLSE